MKIFRFDSSFSPVVLKLGGAPPKGGVSNLQGGRGLVKTIGIFFLLLWSRGHWPRSYFKTFFFFSIFPRISNLKNILVAFLSAFTNLRNQPTETWIPRYFNPRNSSLVFLYQNLPPISQYLPCNKN